MQEVTIAELLMEELKRANRMYGLMSESKCRYCLYVVMTPAELSYLGADPCESCDNMCNWKKKD